MPPLQSLLPEPAEIDLQYRTHYLAADIRQTNISIAVWLVPALLLAYSDYSVFGSGNTFLLLLAIRLALCAFSLYTIQALKKVDSDSEYGRVFLRWAIPTTIMILLINYLWSPFVPPNGAITVLIIFSAYTIFPSRLLIRITPPLLLSAGNLLLHIFAVKSITPYTLLTITVSIAMANILGIIFSSLLQRHRRTEFAARLDEHRVKEELVRLASIDDLTGVFNRRKLFQLAKEELEKFKKGEHALSIMMIDIDHFKRLNDTYGHETGDRVLSQFAHYVKKDYARDNIWGRLGGEEFVLILPQQTATQAKQIADQLRRGLDEALICHPEPITFTISIGVTAAHKQDRSFDEVLKRADKALYNAKNNGRNRTEVL